MGNTGCEISQKRDQIEAIIEENNICEYYDLVGYLRKNELEDLSDVVYKHVEHFNAYIKSRRKEKTKKKRGASSESVEFEILSQDMYLFETRVLPKLYKLIERETAAEPIFIHDENEFYCPACKELIVVNNDLEPFYCGECGQALKWGW